ncbi:SpvB/TcaC N-terminal domain-containing protein [Dactylosporangium sp. NPDC051541]|uniref:SpvB/TcaC N-terminal domain-containing protein n=1 Tax=Dactylosporangium sp. NPDC051541 TaxID=3363977 RepID=UPI0037B3CEC0
MTLPRGGGAIRGIGEKFAANPVTGSGAMSVPLVMSPGRSGFEPLLSLTYDSGAGNGPFGFGWTLELASITRKTDKGLPRYLDAVESDVFILSGAEDLVPLLEPDGTRARDDTSAPGFIIHRYRPRIEGLFARIERWTRAGAPGDVHWRSISRDNVLTIYGADAGSRIADPLDPSRIFSWLICESRDDKGNAIRYRYKCEDGGHQHGPGQDDPFQLAHQRNRGPADDPRRTAQRYPQRVLYGNRTPLLDAQGRRPRFLADLPDPPSDTGADWLFEVRFDYGELDAHDPTGQPETPWRYRPDAFSSYRSGFEVRTCRRCERVLMLHHIPDRPAGPQHAAQPGYDGVVRDTAFGYADEADPALATRPVYSFLSTVVQTGWRQDGGSIHRRSLPPVEFRYTEPVVQSDVEHLDPASLRNLPAGVDGGTYRWTDLHGEGIAGILTEQAGAWFYTRNRSPLPPGKAHFGPLETVGARPNVSLAAGADFMDLAGDGHPDVVVLHEQPAGFYEHDDGEGWRPFRPLVHGLRRDLRDPNVRFVDLDGDGRTDVLITEDDALVWYPSLGGEGFGPPARVVRALDEEKGPRVVFADGTQSIYLADLSGDGLTDLVRIRTGEVCYWPNMGYGRFGAKVTMDNAPWFDNPDQFEHQRLRLADIDGSGTTDLIYLHRDGVRLYFNQSGNAWSRPQVLPVFPPVDDLTSVVPIDLLGNGTACLVWSSARLGDARRPMRYVNLMGGAKPHLLIRTVNNLGAETRVQYTPSTAFYLRDKQAGTPWITRLPFPVHVVERVETYDHISRNHFVTRYAYHHGYFDGVEREFRGFGMVEQWDTEQFAALADAADNVDAASHIAPVHTKTWFHTGIELGREHVSDYFAGLLNAADPGEYYREPGRTDAEARALLLADTPLPAGLIGEEVREACRALKGSMLRHEVYADDADDPGATPVQRERAHTPYTVTEQNFTIRLLQGQGPNRHAVFLTHPCEAITYHYERDPADARVEHILTLDVDDYGNVLKEASIGYGRRNSPLPQPWDRDRQSTPLLTYTENRVTNAIDTPATHRTPLPAEAITYELTGYPATAPAGRYRAADLVEPDPAAPGRLRYRCAAADVPYEAAASGHQRRRQIEALRLLYRRDDLTGLLPLGHLEPLALPGETYKLAFTPGLLAQVFRRPREGHAAEQLLPDPAAVLGGDGGDRGGYLPSQALKADGRFPTVDADDHWWIPSGQSYFSPNPAHDAATESARARRHFYLPRRYRDAFGHDTVVDFDAHDLLMAQTRDALGNRVTVDAADYRVLQPRLLSDPNRNQTEVIFDTLGLVAGTAVMGKPRPAPPEGDSLAGFVADLSQAQIADFLDAADPNATSAALLAGATTRVVYDVDRFRRTRQAYPDTPRRWQPACAATLVRETHLHAPPPPHGLRIRLAFSYTDGFGREIQTKVPAEPGPVPRRDPAGTVIVGVDGRPVMTTAAARPRWVGTGWTVFNNKGRPVRRYEPYFTDTHRFEFAVRVGVSPVLFYDPAERVVVTLHPNHTYDKVVFDAWQQTTYDSNDTCAPRNAQTGDPRTDPDIGGYVAAYFSGQPATWQTWYAQRVGNALGSDERHAAQRAAAHADTPTTAHLDALGRPFLTVARNRVVCAGHDLDGTEESVAARVELDVEGNQRTVRDAVAQAGDPLGRVVMRYAYDMLGNGIHQHSMEAGARWTLNDVAGKPVRAWDSRGHNVTTTYDRLRRAVGQTVRGTFSDTDPLKSNSDRRTLNRDILVDRTEYGEPPRDVTPEQETRAQYLNLRTRVLRRCDGAGIVTNARLDTAGNPTEAYDFKGNLLHSTRRLASDYTAVPDWRHSPGLDAESFESSTRYDALNRAVQSIAPHSSLTRPDRPGTVTVVQPVFNEANLLERVDVWLERAAAPTGLLDPSADAPSPVGVAAIDYDAKGQRTLIDYRTRDATAIRTTYAYDRDTSRRTDVYTHRGVPSTPPAASPAPPAPAGSLQDLHYTYDPAGNVTHLRDAAQQSVYFRNRRVEPSNDYVYDALYRLIQADGREHVGQSGAPTAYTPHDAGRTGLPQPGDGNALATYIERYVYDAAGNILHMRHRGGDPAQAGWTRTYTYAEASLIEPAKASNRLSGTRMGGDDSAAPASYLHDTHGNMLRMPHLGAGGTAPNMHWDYKNHLHQIDKGGGGTAHYAYDAAGERVRKVWEKAPGRVEERIYLGGFEIFRRHHGAIGVDTATFERETLHLADDERRIALVETRTLDTEADDPSPRQQVRYQLGNHVGSVSLELDDRAQIVSYEEYAPYGSTSYQAVSGRTEAPKRYRYSGKEHDGESGLYYFGARYYAAWLGRWCSCDPLDVAVGPNLFRAVDDNPSTLVDKTGKWPEILPGLRRAVDRMAQDPVGAAVGGAMAFIDNTTFGLGTMVNDAIQGEKGATARGIGSRPGAAEAYTMVSVAQPLIEIGIGGTVLIGGGGGGTALTVGTGGLGAPVGVPVVAGSVVVGVALAGHGVLSLASALPRVQAVRAHMAAATDNGGGGGTPAKPPDEPPDPASKPQQKSGPADKPSEPSEPSTAKPSEAPAKPRLPDPSVADHIAREGGLTDLANEIKGLGQGKGATVEIVLAKTKDGQQILVAGINSGSKGGLNAAQRAQLKKWGVNIAPRAAKGMKGAPHAEENIAAYLSGIKARGVRWSKAVVGKHKPGGSSYVCRACRKIIKDIGGRIEGD